MSNEDNRVDRAQEKFNKAEQEVEKDKQRLARDEAEAAEAKVELEKAREHIVIITVDRKPREVRAGKWVVAALKAALGIDPARVLAEVTAHGLKDLDDGAEIIVHGGEQFMTHARTGASS